jgi:hypothetical protein
MCSWVEDEVVVEGEVEVSDTVARGAFIGRLDRLPRASV